jgi:hypothetical protein
MASIRADFIGRLQLKGFSQRTITNYVAAVAALSIYYNRSPLTCYRKDRQLAHGGLENLL